MCKEYSMMQTIREGVTYNIHPSNIYQGIEPGYVTVMGFIDPSGLEDAQEIPQDIITHIENITGVDFVDYLTGSLWDIVEDDSQYIWAINEADRHYNNTWVKHEYTRTGEVRYLMLEDFVNHTTIY